MNRTRKYLICTLALVSVSLLCMGFSQWIITTPKTFVPRWEAGTPPVKEFNIRYENPTSVEGIETPFEREEGETVVQTDDYFIWTPDGFSSTEEAERQTWADKNCSHDFLGWFIDGTEQKVTSFQDIIDYYSEAEGFSFEVRLIARWQTKLKVTITDEDNSYHVRQYLHNGETVTNEGYDDGNEDITVPTYFVKWQADGSDFEGNNQGIFSYTIPDERKEELHFVAHRAAKAHITATDDTVNYRFEGYYMPDAEVLLPDYESGNTDITIGTYFSGWRLGKDIVGDEDLNYRVTSADLGKDTAFIAFRLEKVKVTLDGSSVTEDGERLKATLSGDRFGAIIEVYGGHTVTGYLTPESSDAEGSLTLTLTYERADSDHGGFIMAWYLISEEEGQRAAMNNETQTISTRWLSTLITFGGFHEDKK